MRSPTARKGDFDAAFGNNSQHEMHEMQTIVTDVRGVCQFVSLSVTRLKSAAARAVYAACRVRGVIRCSLRQMPLAFCY